MQAALREFTWCRRKAAYQRIKGLQYAFVRSFSKDSRTRWTSSEVRKTFLDYFTTRDHQYVHSSSVIPRKDEGTYFVNAGMNQFKPIFLGQADPKSDLGQYRRVVNSQKCIRVGGKHNDLADVGRDTYHHTFFEMLGTWSFGDYFKERACGLAWSLLTEVYCLPTDHLYVTYFGGNKELGLGADEECREVWLRLGVPADRVLACGVQDNFWDMGDTGPCGPCTEIHYDRLGHKDSSQLVNTGHPDVLELWNLVFMQFDRQSDGSLRALPTNHVDTGMGMERLTAVMQGKRSNYDTDLFMPLFKAIHKLSANPPYTGHLGPDDPLGRDTAYRIVADHIRMVTVAMSDGLRPGRTHIDAKLRQVLDQCIHHATQELGLSQGQLSQLVPIVTDILGPAFPEMNTEVKQIQEVINESEERYLHLLQTGTKLVKKIIETDTNGNSYLTAGNIADLQDGRWGTSIPPEITYTIAAKLGIQKLDTEGFRQIMDQRKASQQVAMENGSELQECLPGNRLQLQDVTYLEVQGIPHTKDKSKYDIVWEQNGCVISETMAVPSEVLALRTCDEFVDCLLQEDDLCGIVMENTPFYAEAGGQACDYGEWSSEDCTFEVLDVQRTQGYILHVGRVTRGEVIIGESLLPSINASRRCGCSINHTATHLLNHALSDVLGDVRQQGSAVTDNKLVFDFLSLKTKVSASEISEISRVVREMITSRLPVFVEEIPYRDACQIKGLKVLEHEAYPADVRVLSVGVPVRDLMKPGSTKGTTTSVELCGGTHVDNTSRIVDFVITHFSGTKQGTKRITAITGEAAQQAMNNAAMVHNKMKALLAAVKSKQEVSGWRDRQQEIEKLLMGADSLALPKVDRDELISQIDLLKARSINVEKNKQKIQPIIEEIQSVLESQRDAKFVVASLEREALVKQLMSGLEVCSPLRPVMLLSIGKPKKRKSMRPLGNKKIITGVAYVPKNMDVDGLSAKDWISHVSAGSGFEVISSDDKSGDAGNLPSGSQLHFVTLAVSSKTDVQICEQLATDYLEELSGS